MSRRILGTTAAAVVLLGATVVPATAAPAPASAATTVTAAALAPTQVALQVAYPSGTVKTWCVKYRAGMTGADVLAVATPTYGTGPYAGFVLKITNKGTVPPTASNYWAYWRSPLGKASGYTYSSAGVTSTRPAARSVEAWVWNSGSATTLPPKRTFASLCPSAA